MKQHLITGLYLIVGLINFTPLMGVLGQDQLSALYQIPEQPKDMLLLLQHRAVLFGIIGGFIMLSAFQPKHRPTASIMGLTSMLSFILLYHLLEPLNSSLTKVYWIDVIASGMLIVAANLSAQEKPLAE
ncbi:hypothetical protein [Kordiimonas laminariae]|uniref:hypothetical protein n=1 Tax=Kordiimonas laminariae TaxID=2917717 RepID=UPI001FF581A3|nr:hypothetical protein [Kordiimonas laminariae]MCK0068241.1 hypothetical protein [Kordiimonas laminariae]